MLYPINYTPAETYSQPTGVVTRKFVGTYHVDTGAEIVVCSISNRLRKHLIYPIADASSIPHQRVVEVKDIKLVDPVAIGDAVLYKPGEGGHGVITDILPRRTKLSRPAMGTKPLEQVIVANLDQVVAVFAAARPKPHWNLLDRYLVSAETAELEPVICVTKLDLADEDEIEQEAALYRSLGYRVILTSSETGRGLDDLRAALTGKLSALVGMSGVGKTSLLNALQPGLGARVSAVGKRRTGEGRHTTTHMEMFALDGGGAVVDTPGIRFFELWDVEGNDVAYYFREMEPLIGGCRFGADCTHEHEPGCAIRAAVEAGQISPRRHQSYVRMLNGQTE